MSAAEKLESLRRAALIAGGEAQIEKQHAKGKKTARERIEMLLDEGSFFETDQFVTHRASGFGMENSKR
jgi:propionyl-CoA carboxylase beta chain